MPAVAIIEIRGSRAAPTLLTRAILSNAAKLIALMIPFSNAGRREAGQVGCSTAISLAAERNRKNPCIHRPCRVRLTRLAFHFLTSEVAAPNYTNVQVHLTLFRVLGDEWEAGASIRSSAQPALRELVGAAKGFIADTHQAQAA